MGEWPKGLSKQAQAKAKAAETLYREGQLSVQEICDQLSIQSLRFYSSLKHRGVKTGTGTNLTTSDLY